MSARKILITCEHADKLIPSAYQHLFVTGKEDLLSHKGYDIGSFELAKYVARELHAPFYFQKVSRLLIEMNRSLNAKDLFSKYSIELDENVKNQLKSKYYYPYRNEIEGKLAEMMSDQPVLHISIHTFTPSLNGVERLVDVGILCDESKTLELEFSKSWQDKLSMNLPDKLVMINMPYNGADDGFTTYLRNKYPEKDYLGIELEVNQKYVGSEHWSQIKKSIYQTLS